MNNDAPRTASGTQLLDKALDMIDLVERSSQRLTANTIAQACGYPKPTVNRILSALVRRGFLGIDRRDQSYELGMRFTQLAAALRRSHQLVTLVEEQLIALSARSGETVSLGVAELGAVRIVARYHLGLESAPGGPTGAKRPYHASAVGKVILAGMPDKEARRHIARMNFERFTPHTIDGKAALLEELQLVRARGYALDNEEIVTGVRCVAAPIYSARGEIAGAISLSAPTHRMTTKRVEEIVATLGIIAAKATQRLIGAHADGLQASEGVICLRAGGLFQPAAIAASAERILVVDAAAPSIHAFSPDGVLLETEQLDELPDAAAVMADGTRLLARRGLVEYRRRDGTPRTIAFDHIVDALAFGRDGRGYAMGADGGVHDAITGALLFRAGAPASALAVAGKVACLLAADGKSVAVQDVTDGTLVKTIPLDGALGNSGAIATDGLCVWVTGRDSRQIDCIHIESGMVRRIPSPERSITAIAIQGHDLLIAGASLNAALIDQAGHNSGSLYRISSREDLGRPF
jgi:DNA-binding IclR family transcriptional regulator/sugar lactone lactonase YvrE